MLIAFELERALAGAKVVTRNGDKLTDWHYFKNVKDTYPIHAAYNGIIETFTVDGQYQNGGLNSMDLKLEVEPKKYYMNAYRHRNGVMRFGNVCATLQECESSKIYPHEDYGFLETVEITLSQP